MKKLFFFALLVFGLFSASAGTAPQNNCAITVHGVTDYANPWYWSIKTAQMPRDWSCFGCSVTAYAGDIIQVQYPIGVIADYPGGFLALSLLEYNMDGSSQWKYAYMPDYCNVARYRIDGDCAHKSIHFTLVASGIYGGDDVWVPQSANYAPQ